MTAANKDTQPKFDGLDDARTLPGSDNLLYKSITKTRSGHVLELNDNKGAESITLQHRTGAMMQLQPDGSVRFVSQNGMMGFEINGQGYVKVSGAYDVIADGDFSVRAKSGNMHFTGDLQLTVDGTYSVSAKNMTQTIGKKFEMTAEDINITSTYNSAFIAGLQQWLGSGAGGTVIDSKQIINITAKHSIYESALSGSIFRDAKKRITDYAERIDHN